MIGHARQERQKLRARYDEWNVHGMNFPPRASPETMYLVDKEEFIVPGIRESNDVVISLASGHRRTTCGQETNAVLFENDACETAGPAGTRIDADPVVAHRRLGLDGVPMDHHDP